MSQVLSLHFFLLGLRHAIVPPHLSIWELKLALNCGYQNGQLVGPNTLNFDPKEMHVVTCCDVYSNDLPTKTSLVLG